MKHDKMLKAFLIDPEKEMIRPVIYNGDYKEIYTYIDCDCFTVVQIDDVNCIYVDDNGLLNNPRYFFTIKGYAQPLANKGLVLGTDEDGETIGTTLTFNWLVKNIGFQELSVAGFQPLPDSKTGPDHWMGEGIPIIGHVPVFGPPEVEDEKS